MLCVFTHFFLEQTLQRFIHFTGFFHEPSFCFCWARPSFAFDFIDSCCFSRILGGKREKWMYLANHLESQVWSPTQSTSTQSGELKAGTSLNAHCVFQFEILTERIITHTDTASWPELKHMSANVCTSLGLSNTVGPSAVGLWLSNAAHIALLIRGSTLKNYNFESKYKKAFCRAKH